MKRKAAAIFCLLAVMAALPAVTVGMGSKPSARTSATATADSTDSANAASEKEQVCSAAAQLCRADFCDEAVAAVLCLLKNNLKAAPDKFPKVKNNSNEELYQRVAAAYNSISELSIRYKGTRQYIPYAECSGGATVADESYPYLSPVASPWDCLSDAYAEGNTCAGVSLCGLDALCKQGCSAKQALAWYLPQLEIT